MEQNTNLQIASRDLKYYIFDWDDNILRMPTHIHLERRLQDGSWVPHLVSTALFAVIRNDKVNYRPPHGNWGEAFQEFQDFGPANPRRFLDDAETAIGRVLSGAEPPPRSFNTFRKTLTEGRLFAIVTARGHRSETLRKGVELFIKRVLTDEEKRTMLANLRGYIVCYDGTTVNRGLDDAGVLSYYLGLNRYHAVTSPEFQQLMLSKSKGEPITSFEARKQFAIRDFVEHLFRIIEKIGVHKPISVGFSDDDPANVRSVVEYIQERLSKRFPSVRFVVYDTSDEALTAGRKIVVAGQLELGIDD